MRSYIVLLNWNGFRHTIECLESVFRLKYQDFHVVVCDNNSSDGSLEKIKCWARGELLAESENPQLSHLTSPPVAKPIPYCEMTREQAESWTEGDRAQLTLIQNGGNLGFAAGNNVGLRYSLADVDCGFCWLLNNDTVVEPDALSAMVQFMRRTPGVGLCGSMNLSYFDPNHVQAQGGKMYMRWTGRVRTPQTVMVQDFDSTPSSLDYVNGASMLASRDFLERIGLMEESYFLYFEELDWAMRARGRFALDYARDSIIYHKEGAALGSSPDRMKRSLTSDKYLTRSRVMFTKRFFPFALPSVLASIILAAIHRFCLGDVERAKAMMLYMIKGLHERKAPSDVI